MKMMEVQSDAIGSLYEAEYSRAPPMAMAAITNQVTQVI